MSRLNPNARISITTAGLQMIGAHERRVAKSSVDLAEMERFVRKEVNERKRAESAIIIGNVEVVAQRWRCNPVSGRVTEHVRVSYKLAGRRIARADLFRKLGEAS